MTDTAHTDNPEVFGQDPHEFYNGGELPQTLPPSHEDAFWGKDAIKHQADAEKLTDRSLAQAAKTIHTLRLEGPTFVCTSCPNSHTIPLSPNEFTLDRGGNLIHRS